MTLIRMRDGLQDGVLTLNMQEPTMQFSGHDSASIERFFRPDSEIRGVPGFIGLAELAYNRNNWVKACIDLIANSVSGLPWQVVTIDSDGEETVVDLTNELATLIRKPTNQMAWAEFITEHVNDLMIGGETYVLGGPTVEGGLLIRAAMMARLRPDTVTPVPGETVFERLAGFIYRPIGIGGQIRYNLSQMFQNRLPDPRDKTKGISPIEAAWRNVKTSNKATDWINGLLTQGPMPNVAWSFADHSSTTVEQSWGDEETPSNQQRAVQKMTNVKPGAHAWMGDLIPTEIPNPPIDQGMTATKEDSLTEICSVLGVPPMLVGYMKFSTLDNMKEAKKRFFTDTVMPLTKKIIAGFNLWFEPQFGPNLKLSVDVKKIPELQEDQDKRTDRQVKQVSFGIKNRNEIRADNNDENAGPSGDVFLIDSRLESVDVVTGEQGVISPQEE